MPVIINGTTGVTSVNGTAAAPSVTGTDTDTGIVYGTNTVTIATNGTAGLVQDASQNISIGGSVAAQKLNVKGIVAFEAISGSTNNWVNYTYTDSTFRWNYNGSGSDELILNSNGVLSLLNASTTANGVGICFPATQSASTDANTLDDYEEGTWTPTIGLGTFTYGSARYTRVGRIVTVSAYCQNFSDRSTASNLAISGLPFSSASSGSDAVGSLFMRYTNNPVTAVYISTNTSTILFYGSVSGNYTNLLHSNLNNPSAEIYFTITYTTNT